MGQSDNQVFLLGMQTGAYETGWGGAHGVLSSGTRLSLQMGKSSGSAGRRPPGACVSSGQQLLQSLDLWHQAYKDTGGMGRKEASTLMPALRHLPTASGTAALGGSIIDMSPTKQSFSVGKFSSSVSNLKPRGNFPEGRFS